MMIDFAKDLIRKNLRRSIKYSLSGFAGFLFLELITFVGFSIYGRGLIIPVNIIAFISGVALEFFINEHWTTRNEGFHGGSHLGKLIRLFKFELLNAFGNTIVIAVQYVLLIFLNLHPLIGNIIGSGLAFPVNYYLQMKSVWRLDPLR